MTDSDPIPTILIVDDEPDNLDVIETLLGDEDYELHYAASGSGAIEVLEMLHPDLILLDVMMPGMNGIEVCRHIKALPNYQAVPIIMVTALTGKQDLSECLAAGADDFISKPVNRLELTARVRSMLRIHHQHQQLSSFNSRLEAKVAQRTAELHTLLYQDHLTQLPSRLKLLDQVTALLGAGAENFALAYLDCDQFKLVNGAFGYGVGNELIQAIAQRLQAHLRSTDLLARMGEDEFCFLLHPLGTEFSLQTWVEGVLEEFAAPFTVADCEVFMTACVGIAQATENYPQPDALVQAADTAMYQAKLRGKGCYQVFDQQMYVATRDRLLLENALQRALEQGEFVTYYQPIVHLDNLTLAGFEALVRWQHPERGLVPPGAFIPCMEETGLVVPVGLVVLRQACEQLYRWHQQGWPELTMSVNLSVRQFSSPTLLEDIDQVLAETGVNPACLKLEITESAIMDSTEAAITLTEALRSRRIQISIDDFGTGYSSLGYLHRLPVDNLKIDRAFVNGTQPHPVGQKNTGYQVVNTITTLAKQLGLTVTAEGVETLAQVKSLQNITCEYGQGYFFSRPLPPEDIERTCLPRAQQMMPPTPVIA